MSLTAYCEFDEIRAALGVNSKELKDSVLSLPVYEMGLVRELNRLSTSLDAAFYQASAVPAEQRTAQQARFFNAVHLFSVYTVSAQVGVSLANFAVKSVGDGKATVSRSNGEPYENVMEMVRERRATYTQELAEAYAALTSGAVATSSVPAIFLAANRTYDPVTGS